MRGFRETIERDPERAAVVARLPVETKLALYAGLLRARLHDIQLKRWVRTGVISKAWLGTGEEATTVGPVHALQRGTDIVAPMIRNAAACCELGLPVSDMLRAYLGSEDSPARGRDLHVGAWAQGVLQPISHVGDMVPVTTGIALTFKIRQEPRVALTWVGDGSTKTAAAHEGTNFAAVQKLPAIFIVQNNQVALGTRLDQHHLPGNFNDWAASYGIPGAAFDGNNVLDAYAATKLAAERCRAVRALGQAGSDRDVRGILEGGRDHREAARGDRGRCDGRSGAGRGTGVAKPGQDAARRERAAGCVREERPVAANVRRCAG